MASSQRAVEKARQQVAGMLNCQAEEIFFTSGGTESNNHAIKGMARVLKDKGRHIITSTVSTRQFWRYATSEERGLRYHLRGCGRHRHGQRGHCDCRHSTGHELITVMHANNEVGPCNPSEIGRSPDRTASPSTPTRPSVRKNPDRRPAVGGRPALDRRTQNIRTQGDRGAIRQGRWCPKNSATARARRWGGVPGPKTY